MLPSYWEKEEFEDLIVKGIVALYEDSVSNEYAAIIREVPPERKLSPVDLHWMRKVGLYFAPSDRIADATEVDIRNDGLPQVATIAFNYEDNCTKNNEDVVFGYLGICHTKRIQQLPSVIKKTHHGIPYMTSIFQPMHTGGYVGMKDYVTIDPSTGIVYPTKSKKLIDGNVVYAVDKPHKDGHIQSVAISATCISLYSDRKHLWNVEAKEHDARVSFGVYPEQIKSLFYARNLPLSATGRKRPILHWVAAHNRRLKNGTDIEIETFLRGTTEFEMGGTQFKITNPQKNA